MLITLQDHITHLQSFLSNPTTSNAEDAAKSTLQITNAAAQSAVPKSAIALAQSTLAALSKTPCVPAIPNLLSICERDPFEAIDVFLLSSAAWKALVAAAITEPPPPVIAMRIISSAALSATGMIAKCLQSSTQTSTEVLRTVKIAKFYCLNAARCSKAFFSSVGDLQPNMLTVPFTQIFDLLALSSFVLLFDQHALLAAHNELFSEILPLVTSTLTTLLAMAHQLSLQDRQLILERALETIGKHSILEKLHLPTPVLQLLALLHVSRCALRSKQDLNTSIETEHANCEIVSSFLIPCLFQCFHTAYEEISLFREQGSGTPFLDTVTSSTVDIFLTAELGMRQESHGHTGIEFLIEQVTSDNAICSHIAQETLFQFAVVGTPNYSWRDYITTTVYGCLRTSLTFESHQTGRWLSLAARLGVIYVQEGKTITGVLAASRTLHHISSRLKDCSTTEPLHDPITNLLIAQICQLLSHSEAVSSPRSIDKQSQRQDTALCHVLEVFEVEAAKVAERAKDLVLTSTGYAAVNTMSLLPRVLDSGTACGAALVVLQSESTNPSMVSAALNILDPSTMDPAAVDTACSVAASVHHRDWVDVYPAILSFISKAASCLGETVSLGQWQQLSALVESCLVSAQQENNLGNPKSDAITGTILHFSAIALSAVKVTIPGQRQTQTSLPVRILNDAEDALKVLEMWRAGEHGCDLEQERYLVQAERSRTAPPPYVKSQDRRMALYRIREARDRLLEAAGLLLDEASTIYFNDEVKDELSTIEASLSSISRCRQNDTVNI